MDVLRQLLRSLVVDGLVVDLLSVGPPEQVVVDSAVLGELDNSRFFARAVPAAAGLDQLAAEGILVGEHQERFTILIHYPTGADLDEDIAQRQHTTMPASLGRLVRSVEGPCEVRDHCLVRRFRKVR